MFLRVFTFLLFLILITSCDTISFSKSTKTLLLDTIVDFSVVDISPSFKACDSLIDKEKKSDCFRANIHKEIRKELLQHAFTIKDSISEIIYVDLLINSTGIISLEDIQSSENLKNQLPQLDSLLQLSVDKLPKILPARKHSMRVTSKYRLPIKIQLKV